MSKFKAGTVEKNSSTIGPLAGIKPTPIVNVFFLIDMRMISTRD